MAQCRGEQQSTDAGRVADCCFPPHHPLSTILAPAQAKTHEKVDSLGENRSIACHAVVMLYRRDDAKPAPA